MSVVVLAGRRWNFIERLSAAPVPESADAKYPIANLANGRPWEPFRYASPGGSGYIDIDLQNVPNGEMEAALTGGLPAAGWAKSAGATLTRDTTIKNSGAASVKLTAAASGDGAWFDIVVRPGERFVFGAACRSTVGGSKAAVRLRNLATGKYLDNGGLWKSFTWNFIETPASSWVHNTLASYQVESWADCRCDRVTLRLEILCANTPVSDHWFDDLVFYPEVDLCAILGHDIPPVCGGLQVKMDATSPASTVRATVPLPATWGTAWAKIPVAVGAPPYRYVRLAVATDPIERAITIGDLVLAQSRAFSAYPNQGRRLRVADPRERQEIAVGELFATPRGARARHEVALEFDLLHGSQDQREEFREILLRSRSGAHPALLILDDTATDGTGCLLARLEEEHEFSERSDLLDRVPVRFKELPLLPVLAP